MSILSSLQPFEYIFDPVAPDQEQDANPFPFLENADKITPLGLESSVCFKPKELGLPWPATFPVAIESKYWREAKTAAESLMLQIRRQSHAESGQFDQKLEPALSSKDLLLIDTASRAPAHMFPASNANQIKVLAKGNIFVFIHDDVYDSQIYHDGLSNNPLKEALDELEVLPDDPMNLKREWKNPIFQQWVDECANENLTGGLLFVLGALEWAKFAIENPPKTKQTFASWPEYMQFRKRDFMASGICGMLQISTGIQVSRSERLPLDEMWDLYITHFCLTNDIYSYQKEVLEVGGDGSGLVNGVSVLEHILQVSTETAKRVLRSIIIGVEKRLAAVYKAFLESGRLNERQLRFARSMIEGLAGNLFYSSTCARYARVVPGSRVSNVANSL